MKIKEIRAFAMKPQTASAYAVRPGNEELVRRPSWKFGAEVATPMTKFSRFRERASWNKPPPTIGCVVIAEDGSWGFGTTNQGSAAMALINDYFAPRLIGEDPFAIERLYDLMVRMSFPYGTSGLTAYATSAIDLALWDLKGRALGMPVYSLAGGPVKEKIACYATGNESDWHVELGFKATKLICPHGAPDGLDGIDRNEELVARHREMIGPNIDLMLDCWMSFDLEFAVRLGERLRPYGLKWMEDCFKPDDLGSLRALRQRLPFQTLATGEHWHGQTFFLEAAATHLVDIVQPDILWAGGFTACRRIAAITEAAGIDIMLHAGMNTPYGQHFTYACNNASWGEYLSNGGVGVPLELTTTFPGMAVPRDGWLVPSDAPGFGHGFTLDAIEALVA